MDGEKPLEAAEVPVQLPNSELITHMLNDLWNNRNFKVVDDTLSQDCITRGPLIQTQGVAEFKNSFVLPLFNAFPDLKYVCHEVIQEMSTVVLRWSFWGTHAGEYRGYEATNKKISWSGLSINRINTEGKLYEIQYFFDSRVLYNQLANAPAHR